VVEEKVVAENGQEEEQADATERDDKWARDS